MPSPSYLMHLLWVTSSESTDLTRDTSPKVYRCFLVWGKSYLVSVVPLLLFIADFGE
jgi:hypothetical protein